MLTIVAKATVLAPILLGISSIKLGSGKPLTATSTGNGPSRFATTDASLAGFGQQALEIVPKLSGVSATYQNGFGLTADIRNTSMKPIWLAPRWVTLTLPPELNASLDSPGSWYGLIVGRPTSRPTDDDGHGEGGFNRYQAIQLLQPGEIVPVIWMPQDEPCRTTRYLAHLRCKVGIFAGELRFVPGEYSLKIAAAYWLSQGDAIAEADNYHTQTAETRVLVTAPQWIIMFGALLGAVGAYFVVPNVRDQKVGEGRTVWRMFKSDLAGLTSAALFAVIVTILLARLADTQFLIKVSVNDFWGAIAIGFVATATRKTILAKLAPSPKN